MPVRTTIGCLIAGAALLAAPAFVSPYLQSLGFLFFMYVALALSWNLLGGFTGYFSFGHIGFFGLGAYVTAVLIDRASTTWWAAVIAGGLAAFLAALVIAYPCLRLRGIAFAIVMLAFSQVMRLLAYIFEPYTNAGMGITLPGKDTLFSIYYSFAAIAAVTLALSLWVDRSTFGLHLKAIRDDELSAESIGIDTQTEKLKAFLLSAVIPGLCGGLYIWYLGYAHPEEAFSLRINTSMIVMALLGGSGTVAGPVIGAFVLFVLSEFLWAKYPVFHFLFYGALILGLMLFLPDGLVGLWRRLTRYKDPNLLRAETVHVANR